MTKPTKQQLLDVVTDLIETVEAVGGVFYDRRGQPRPYGDPHWVDLGLAYVKACDTLKREVKLAETRPDGWEEAPSEEEEE